STWLLLLSVVDSLVGLVSRRALCPRIASPAGLCIGSCQPCSFSASVHWHTARLTTWKSRRPVSKPPDSGTAAVLPDAPPAGGRERHEGRVNLDAVLGGVHSRPPASTLPDAGGVSDGQLREFPREVCMVEGKGFEPSTSALRTPRSPN